MTAFISSEVYKLYKLIETLLRYLVQKTDRQTNWVTELSCPS